MTEYLTKSDKQVVAWAVENFTQVQGVMLQQRAWLAEAIKQHRDEIDQEIAKGLKPASLALMDVPIFSRDKVDLHLQHLLSVATLSDQLVRSLETLNWPEQQGRLPS